MPMPQTYREWFDVADTVLRNHWQTREIVGTENWRREMALAAVNADGSPVTALTRKANELIAIATGQMVDGAGI